jgi:hypothetical protein
MVDRKKQNENLNALEGIDYSQRRRIVNLGLVAVTMTSGEKEGRVIVPDSKNYDLARQIVESRSFEGEKFIGFLAFE